MTDFPINIKPRENSTMSQSPDVNVIDYGDGYSQRIPAGINNSPVNRPLTFDLTQTEKDTLLTFIQNRGGVESFNYTMDGVPRKFIVKSWRFTDRQPNHWIARLTFNEVFDL